MEEMCARAGLCVCVWVVCNWKGRAESNSVIS